MNMPFWREIIKIQSVKADLLDNDIGYIRLTSFNENSGRVIPARSIMNKNLNEKNYLIFGSSSNIAKRYISLIGKERDNFYGVTSKNNKVNSKYFKLSNFTL